MGKYDIGDIVYVSKYDYDNGEKGSNHLFVIIDSETYVTVEYFGFIVSSNIKKSKSSSKYRFNETIEKNNVNNLKTNSIVKCDQLYNINVISYIISRKNIYNLKLDMLMLTIL